ncbi:hypothetical protein NPIL_460901 [Nephila pilipes]|uniref:Uncharacterized protein n=1 Tax=Nephila pilipes TaxID=299642 RepID=A0A8X6NDK5_NEPPI|nr:hypothetical protein NPIL_460901 [Nephila pilipes]
MLNMKARPRELNECHWGTSRDAKRLVPNTPIKKSLRSSGSRQTPSPEGKPECTGSTKCPFGGVPANVLLPSHRPQHINPPRLPPHKLIEFRNPRT